MNPAIQQLCQIRMQQARETIEESKTLYHTGLLRGAVNRAYYAMFYAVLALSVVKQINTSKHSGLIAFFDREYIKTGVFQKSLSKSLHLAFQRRQESDYGNAFTVNPDEALQAIDEAIAFVDSVDGYIQPQLNKDAGSAD